MALKIVGILSDKSFEKKKKQLNLFTYGYGKIE